MSVDISPSQSYVTKQKIKNGLLGFYGLLILFIVLGIDIYTLIYLKEFTVVVWFSTIILIVMYWMTQYFLQLQEKEIDRWHKGEIGEAQVKATINELSDFYITIQDVKLSNGRGNIDHIVIGPTGIYSLETKNVKPKRFGWRLKLYPDLYRKFHTQCYREAKDVERHLEYKGYKGYKVQPLLVLVNQEYINAEKTWDYRGIQVVPLHLLKEYITSSNARLSQQQINELSQAFK